MPELSQRNSREQASGRQYGMWLRISFSYACILAEPGAIVGFAGARVIEQTTKKSLPVGFQRAEFVLEHGFVDAIAARNKQKRLLTELLKMHEGV